jgi:hypothetical protein
MFRRVNDDARRSGNLELSQTEHFLAYYLERHMPMNFQPAFEKATEKCELSARFSQGGREKRNFLSAF